MLIIGAGLSGLLAGVMYPTATIIEAQAEPRIGHRATLRFRTDKVARATGIDFRRVTVRKGISYFGSFVQPSIRLANWYSTKVAGGIFDRSIWDIAPAERWIAPEDFQAQLIDQCSGRITWGEEFQADSWISPKYPILSTIPMPKLCELYPKAVLTWPSPNFAYQPIVVDRYRITGGCDVYQTVYFPDPGMKTYRATLTGDLLIVESTALGDPNRELDQVLDAFGIETQLVETLERGHHQRYGKIAPIDEAWRKRFILQMTTQYGIYSVGRFALWKNILLDDVHDDLLVIKRLIRLGHYEQHLNAQKG